MRLWDQTLAGPLKSLVFKNHCMVVFSCYLVASLLLALLFILLVVGPHQPFGCHSISQPDYSGTYPLVHLYSKDNSIQRTQNSIPENCSHYLCICYLYWRDTSFQGKGTLLLGPKTWLITTRVDNLKCTVIKMMPAFTNWTISLKSMYCTCEKFNTQYCRDTFIMIFYTLSSYFIMTAADSKAE